MPLAGCQITSQLACGSRAEPRMHRFPAPARTRRRRRCGNGRIGEQREFHVVAHDEPAQHRARVAADPARVFGDNARVDGEAQRRHRADFDKDEGGPARSTHYDGRAASALY